VAGKLDLSASAAGNGARKAASETSDRAGLLARLTGQDRETLLLAAEFAFAIRAALAGGPLHFRLLQGGIALGAGCSLVVSFLHSDGPAA
jgi:hypothetical protein